jgi:aldehyde dehydrogenase (NAD+)
MGQTADTASMASPGPASPSVLDIRDPSGGFRDSGSPFKEQGAPGLYFYTRIKTAAVRHQW